MLQNLKTLRPYYVRQRWLLTTIAALSCLLAATAVLTPWPMKLLVDSALGDTDPPAIISRMASWMPVENHSLALVLLASLGVFCVFLLSAALDVALSWAWMASGQRMVYDLAVDTFRSILNTPLPILQRRSVGDYLERLSGDTWSVYTVASDVLVRPVQHLLTLVGIAWVTFWLNPLLAAVAFTAAPIVALSIFYFGPKLKQRAVEGRRNTSRLSGFVHQTVSSMPLVKAYASEDRNQEHYAGLVDDLIAVSLRGVWINKSFGLFNGLANSASRAAVIFVGGLQVLQGNMAVGTLLVFLSYVRTLQKALTELLGTYAKVKAVEASLDRIQEVLDAQGSGSPALTASRASSAITLSPANASIEFQGVTHRYADANPALHDIHLQIAPGQQVAIVGPSGAGKSTLVGLIPRLFDPAIGSVRIAGVDTRELNLDHLRESVAMVLQQPFLLPMSVHDNIALGARGANRTAVRQAAIAAQADEFITNLPDGYDTILGQAGTTLSGGQRQRIAIARAILRDAAIIILDEPAAALDAQTEDDLMTAIGRLTAGRTTVMISHRLSSVQAADLIVVMDAGRVVETGTHEELLAKSGTYARLHTIQHPSRPTKEVAL